MERLGKALPHTMKYSKNKLMKNTLKLFPLLKVETTSNLSFSKYVCFHSMTLIFLTSDFLLLLFCSVKANTIPVFLHISQFLSPRIFPLTIQNTSGGLKALKTASIFFFLPFFFSSFFTSFLCFCLPFFLFILSSHIFAYFDKF